MFTNEYVDAINAVIADLIPARIPFTVNPAYEGLQLRFPWYEGDVVCHKGTYGKVESYQFPWDEGDVTTMEPKEMATKIIQLYLEGTWE